MILFGLHCALAGFAAGMVLAYGILRLAAKAESAILRAFGIVQPCPCAPCAHDRRQWREHPPGAKAEEAMTKLYEAARRYHPHRSVRES
jgi:hypothetical protein